MKTKLRDWNEIWRKLKGQFYIILHYINKNIITFWTIIVIFIVWNETVRIKFYITKKNNNNNNEIL